MTSTPTPLLYIRPSHSTSRLPSIPHSIPLQTLPPLLTTYYRQPCESRLYIQYHFESITKAPTSQFNWLSFNLTNSNSSITTCFTHFFFYWIWLECRSPFNHQFPRWSYCLMRVVDCARSSNLIDCKFWGYTHNIL